MITDVNVHLSRWPFRRLPEDSTPRLAERLRRNGVTQAWAGSFDALLHRDIATVNSRLTEECRGSGGLLLPFGTVNPILPDWKEDLRRCVEVHRMPGIRLYPNYHGYTLGDGIAAELLSLADERSLIVQIVAKMEDERTQHPLVRVPAVNLKSLVALVKSRPKLRVVVLNGLMPLQSQLVGELAAAGNVSFDIATLEGVGGITNLLKAAPLERILFGSHAPFFVWESAQLKLKESELGAHQSDAITHENAKRLLP
ncbi:MAG: amidohydrolase family protein [Planctomycetaceae bacterium]